MLIFSHFGQYFCTADDSSILLYNRFVACSPVNVPCDILLSMLQLLFFFRHSCHMLFPGQWSMVSTLCIPFHIMFNTWALSLLLFPVWYICQVLQINNNKSVDVFDLQTRAVLKQNVVMVLIGVLVLVFYQQWKNNCKHPFFLFSIHIVLVLLALDISPNSGLKFLKMLFNSRICSGSTLCE